VNLQPLLKLLAMQAIAYAERLALTLALQTGAKMLGTEKKANAVAWVRMKWAEMTRDVPVLNATTIDDDLIGDAVQAAFDFAGVKLNEATSEFAPKLDTELPEGGLQ